MFIEMAAEALKARARDGGEGGGQAIISRELKELDGFGINRLNSVLIALGNMQCVPVTARGGISNCPPVATLAYVEAAYLLGLETARVLLAGNPAAVKAGVSL